MDPEPLQSGGPQGQYLTMVLFLVLCSDSALAPAPPLPLGAVPGDVNCVPAPLPPRETKDEIRLKYQDDLSLGEVIDLKTQLCQSSNQAGPKTFHHRNDLELRPNTSKIQIRLNELHEYVQKHDIAIICKKTKNFPVGFSRTKDFIPKLTYDSKLLEVTYKTKLLWVVWTANCEWDENTIYLTNRANSRMYFLRRLKHLGASIWTLKEVYTLFVRSILEYCVPLWAGNLSKKSVKMLTRVEKNALRVIFPDKTYEQSIESLKMRKLADRRVQLTKACAQKMAKNEKFSDFFIEKSGPTTRSNCKFVIPKVRTNRHKYSP